jgi:hypothetical protein
MSPSAFGVTGFGMLSADGPSTFVSRKVRKMPQASLEVTNLELLFGELDEQEELFNESMVGLDESGGMVMTTTPCLTTATRVSVVRRC